MLSTLVFKHSPHPKSTMKLKKAIHTVKKGKQQNRAGNRGLLPLRCTYGWGEKELSCLQHSDKCLSAITIAITIGLANPMQGFNTHCQQIEEK